MSNAAASVSDLLSDGSCIADHGEGVGFWMEALPENILLEILMRLPMETIATAAVRVCHSWRSFIQQSYFYRAYICSSRGIVLQIPASLGKVLGNHLSEHGCYRNGLICNHDVYTTKKGNCTNKKGNCEGYYCAFIPTKQPNLHVLSRNFFLPHNFRVANSCQGLILLISQYNQPALVCNPLLGSIATLPADPLLGSDETQPYGITGLGFDSIEEVFKVFNFIIIHEQQDHYKTRVCTLHSGVWDWRPALQGDPGCKLRGGRCTIVEGKLHWLVDDGRLILALDMHSEAFIPIPLPDMIGKRCPTAVKVDITEVGGPLTVLMEVYPNSQRVEVWAMKKYGHVESWAKETSLPEIWPPFLDDSWWLKLHWEELLMAWQKETLRKWKGYSLLFRNSPEGLLRAGRGTNFRNVQVEAHAIPFLPSTFWFET